MDEQLPPSLAVNPNIPWHEQTLEQLRQERAYWQGKIDAADGWGAAIAAASGFVEACDTWIKRREAEHAVSEA